MIIIVEFVNWNWIRNYLFVSCAPGVYYTCIQRCTLYIYTSILSPSILFCAITIKNFPTLFAKITIYILTNVTHDNLSYFAALLYTAGRTSDESLYTGASRLTFFVSPSIPITLLYVCTRSKHKLNVYLTYENTYVGGVQSKIRILLFQSYIY